MVVNLGASASPGRYASADTDIIRNVIDLYDKSGSSQLTPPAK
jgi:hypothetical protein